MINKILKFSFVLIGIVLFSAMNSFAQGKKVVNWTTTAVQQKDGIHLQVKATMDYGFHIWAFNAGGDGSLINTHLEVTAPKEVLTEWKSKEAPKSEMIEFMEEAPVNYYENTVTFETIVPAPKGSKQIEVKVLYQTCNAEMCYPPTEETLIIKL